MSSNVEENKKNNIESQEDSLASTSTEEGLCSNLKGATLVTANLDAIKSFYVDGMKMTLEGPIDLSPEMEKTQRAIWEIPDSINYQFYHLHRRSVPSLIQIRLLVLDQETPHIHKSYDSRELGPFSLGFPNGDQVNLDKIWQEQGLESMAPMQVGEIPRPDGTTYPYWETIYKAPDFLHAVGITRGDGMPQLAPIDESNNYGGPGYSAQVLSNSDHELIFFTDVLDLELRADREWETGEGSALGIEAGVPFRFALVYAKGNNHNHLLFLDYRDGKFIDPGVAPRIPNRGLTIWSFETKNMEQVKLNAERFGSSIIHEPTEYNSPIFGRIKIMTILAPNGFMIELYQK